ncbi:MAG TPA: SWIM zinc finger family protein [Thermomicrobiales bacterium]
MGTPQPVAEPLSFSLPLPILTAPEVAEMTDDGSFGRGRDYHRQEAIRQPVRRGRTLSALCRGSEPAPYRVQAELADPGVRGRKIVSYGCSCPRGGFCKHIVALLLTWIEALDEFAVLPTTAEILADQSREVLLRLIDQMLEHDPSLVSLVDRLRPAPPPPPAAPGEARLRTINQAAVRRKVARALDDVSYGEEYDSYASYREYLDGEASYSEAAEQLRGFVDQAEELEAVGRLADAIVVYTTVAEEAIEYDDKVGDGTVDQFVLECGRGLLRCFERQASLPESDRFDASDRTALVESLYNVWLFVGGPGWGDGETVAPDPDDVVVYDDGYVAAPWPRTVDRGGPDVEAAIAAVATDAERTHLESWLRDLLGTATGEGERHRKRSAIRFLFALRRDTGSDDDLLAEYKQAELWDDAATLLLKLGRTDEAIALAGRHLKTAAQTIAFADRLRESGDEGAASAIGFVDGRLWETEGITPRDDLAYLDWLSARYAEQGMVRQAFESDRQRFKRRPYFQTYEAVRQAAERPGLEADLWQRTRPELIAELTNRRLWGTLIDIYLHEGQIAEAIAALKELERPRDLRQGTVAGFGGYGSYGYDGALGAGNYRVRVAKAAERDYPDEAIRLYRALADAAITDRNRQAYATAATYLVAVRRLMETTGQAEAWRELITALRDEHRRLRALKEELDALGLN